MNVAAITTYGGPEVLTIRDAPIPATGPDGFSPDELETVARYLDAASDFSSLRES